MGTWDAYSHTVAGRRETNEDGVLILPLGDDGCFYAVADGMGGIKGGEVASEAVLDVAREFLIRRFAGKVRSDQLKKILRDLYAAADAAIRRKQKENPHLAGMGTTLSCLLVQGDRYVVGNIGDSRMYRLNAGRLLQITTDHTYVQEMMTKTGVRPDAGVVRKFGHVVTRSIEGGKEKPDIFPREGKCFTLEEGDGFLLCSDGLIIDKSADQESSLERLFRESASLKEAAERMISFALDAGSSDNVSVVLATRGDFPRVSGKEEESTPRQDTGAIQGALPAGSKRPNLFSRAFLSFIVVALVALVVLVVWRSFGQEETGQEAITAALPEEGESTVGERPSWQPFGVSIRRSYLLSDDFAWTPYPYGEVKEYEIRFGAIGPRVFVKPVCSLKSIDGLRGGVPYRVSVIARCSDGRHIPGASGIFVFR